MKSEMVILLVSFSCLLFSLSEGRKFEAVQNTRKVSIMNPKVMTKQLEFVLDKHYWNIDMTPPTLKLGW
jgi:hypothetical protein